MDTDSSYVLKFFDGNDCIWNYHEGHEAALNAEVEAGRLVRFRMATPTGEALVLSGYWRDIERLRAKVRMTVHAIRRDVLDMASRGHGHCRYSRKMRETALGIIREFKRCERAMKEAT